MSPRLIRVGEVLCVRQRNRLSGKGLLDYRRFSIVDAGKTTRGRESGISQLGAAGRVPLVPWSLLGTASA